MSERVKNDGLGRTEDLRLKQLVALVDEGNEEAIGDLFREYGVIHGVDAVRSREGSHE